MTRIERIFTDFFNSQIGHSSQLGQIGVLNMTYLTYMTNLTQYPC